MKLTRILFAASLPLLAAACAKGPDAIAPVPMGNAYVAMECQNAVNELNAERANLQGLENQQRSARTGDAIGVFLIGVPTSSLTGGDKAGELGASKGKVLALEARVATCTQ